MKKFGRILSLLLVGAMLLLCASCAGNSDDVSSAPTESDDNVTAESKAEGIKGTYFSTDIWQPIPLVTKEAKAMGFAGGEGCQWLTGITFDKIDGSVAYATVDAAGVYKSTDGGKSWSPATIGVIGEGCTGVAIDPTNNKRAALVSTHNESFTAGLQFTTNQGESWSLVDGTKLKTTESHDFRTQIAFDESSYDATLDGCKVIYWTTNLHKSDADKGGLYKSTDGGEHWSLIPNTQQYERCNIAVHPTTGDVYLSNSSGLFKSTNGGESFTSVYSGDIHYLTTTKSEPDSLYFTTDNALYVYDTVSGSSTQRNVSGYPTECANFISVAPSDPNYMLVTRDKITYKGGSSGGGWTTNYYSHDGGKTWNQSKNDTTGAFISFQGRENPTSFHPTNPKIVIKLGGDFIMRSEDGGMNYKMSSDGYNVMCIGGRFNFNVNNPKLISVSSQDYNGGFSTDGGDTWTYLNWSGADWGGFTYGAYMINETSAVAGLATSWTSPREIVTTFDGGKTINHTGIKTEKDAIGMGVKGDDNIVFYADYRSTDGGHTWTQMDGCTGVYTGNSDGSMLFGVGNYYIVISTDKGETWTPFATLGQDPTDIAYNEKDNKVIAAASGAVNIIDVETKKITKVTGVNGNVKGVAVDPDNNDIVYAASITYHDYSADSAWRSIDGGMTWTCINRSANDGREGPDGGRATGFVRVDSAGNAWFSCHCRGLWKIPRPEIG